ncbi:MAG: ThiF family adenylyltransferase, partial [Candidatus Acidiferrales bacterium]
MSVTLAFTEDLWDDLCGALSDNLETAGIILAGKAETDLGLTLLARSTSWVPERHYIERGPDGLSISSPGFVPAIKTALGDQSIPVFFHTHPRGAAGPSRRDDRVDEQLKAFVPRRSRQPYYVSLIVAGTGDEPTFTGRVYLEASDQPLAISRLRVIGRRWWLLPAADARHIAASEPSAFDRQVRAFGAEGQRLLRTLRIGVVGAGGTGSAVCEQLIRLGVGSVTVIDHDVLSESNLTRVHESRLGDV